MEELNTTDSAQPICYELSVSYDILTESEYGSTGDSVLDSHKAKLRTHIDSIINETEEINNNGTPTGFLCIMALIAYLAELVYGDVDGKTGDKPGLDKAKENGEHFQTFLREKMSNGCRDYGGIACDLYRQVRNGLMHCYMLFDQQTSPRKIALCHSPEYAATTKSGEPTKFRRVKLSDGKIVTVIRAADLISDIRYAVNSIFTDEQVVSRMIEFTRTHPPVVGILNEECKLQSPR